MEYPLNEIFLQDLLHHFQVFDIHHPQVLRH
nr:MAG TPA: protein of unknown function (UPF0240) [Caudoviricetes sp.]DAI98752.1 MAG TPA: protein of unknown function (UPF0240) [Caudoviricetes sp.]